MPVYVDALFVAEATGPQAFRVGQRNGHRWCHLWADTETELHVFALGVGMKREWFQNKPGLTPAKRERAVKAGALEMSARERFLLRRSQRAGETPAIQSQAGRAAPLQMNLI